MKNALLVNSANHHLSLNGSYFFFCKSSIQDHWSQVTITNDNGKLWNIAEITKIWQRHDDGTDRSALVSAATNLQFVKDPASVRRNKVKGNKWGPPVTHSALNTTCLSGHQGRKPNINRPRKCSPKEDIIGKTIQGALFFPFLWCLKTFHSAQFGGGGGNSVLFSWRDTQAKKQKKKKKNIGVKPSYRNNTDPLLDALQMHSSAN